MPSAAFYERIGLTPWSETTAAVDAIARESGLSDDDLARALLSPEAVAVRNLLAVRATAADAVTAWQEAHGAPLPADPTPASDQSSTTASDLLALALEGQPLTEQQRAELARALEGTSLAGPAH